MASLRSLLSNISSVIRLNAFFVCNKYVPSKLVTNTIRVNQGRFNIHTTAGKNNVNESSILNYFVPELCSRGLL